MSALRPETSSTIVGRRRPYTRRRFRSAEMEWSFRGERESARSRHAQQHRFGPAPSVRQGLHTGQRQRKSAPTSFLWRQKTFSRTFAAVDGAGIKRKWAPVIFDACWHELRPNVCRFVRYCDQNVTRDKQAGRNLRTYAHHIVQMVPVFHKKNHCFYLPSGIIPVRPDRSRFRLALSENSIRTIDA